ncbi:MAG: sulfatase, partial [Verrucomicrobiota bacterium]
ELVRAQPKHNKTNVLMIVIDDLRPELGCYGVEEIKSPNIDKLAAKSMLFERAYSQYPVCNPSRASFLSGLRPYEVGIISNLVPFRRLHPDMVTLPQLFRNNGYYTAGIGKIYHLSVDTPPDSKRVLFKDPASWDYFYDALGETSKLGKKGEGRNLTEGRLSWAHWRAAEGDDVDQPDGLATNEAIRILEENHEKPFFMGFGLHKPHDPFVAPQKYFELYPEGTTKLAVQPEDQSPTLKYSIPNKTDFEAFTDKERSEFKRAYQACVSFADAQVGKVMDTLDRLKLWDNTIVILMGDHGYHLGERNWWNKVTVFELGSRAPMIIWAPQAKGMGNSTKAIMEFIDLYPTLIDYAGLEAPHKLSGVSLRQVLDDPANSGKQAAYSQINHGKKGIGLSVRTDRWRYTEWGKDGKFGVELYDHDKDSGEHYNLGNNPEYADIRKKLSKLLLVGFPKDESL